MPRHFIGYSMLIQMDLSKSCLVLWSDERFSGAIQEKNKNALPRHHAQV